MPSRPRLDDAAQEFGRSLASARRKRKLTQQILGERMGRSREYISRLERGVSNESRSSSANPTMALMLELSMALNMQLRLDQTRSGGGIAIEFVDPTDE